MTPGSRPDAKSPQQGLVIERIFDAPRDLVWKAWTDPEMLMQWWGPKIFTCPAARIDLRVGGKYLVCMQSETGEEAWKRGIWSTGEYREIVEPEKLVMTDCFADENGNVVPSTHYGMEGIPLEMLVTVTFEALAHNQTRMTLVHEGLPAGEHSEGANIGWNESFDKLAEAVVRA